MGKDCNISFETNGGEESQGDANEGKQKQQQGDRDNESNHNSGEQQHLNALSKKKRRAKNVLRRSTTNPKDLVPETDDDIRISDFPRAADELSLRDIRLVARQLGYLPLNIVKIGAYNTLNQAVPVSPGKTSHTKSALRHISVHNPLVSVLYPLSLNKPERQNRDPNTMSLRNNYKQADSTADLGDDDEEDNEDDDDDDEGPTLNLGKLGDRPEPKLKVKFKEQKYNESTLFTPPRGITDSNDNGTIAATFCT